ncbi:expansin EXLX1 family cellulose-binding protein [Dactylosporangium sp. NPDC051541]|uniref:expansin EXLX1 family cellulose-binding protein n=1 Tax=Dactylosporangium sp. NPDC051541 TaxID=3363977 RepID=UPI0037988264
MNRRHLRWIVPAATVVIASVVAVVLVTQVGGSAACAAGGSASYYTAGRNGMCNLGTPADGAYAAVGKAELSGGKNCGTLLDVTGPNGTTRVQIVDLCPSCPAGKLDLGKGAFQRIGSLSAGIIPVTYATVRDPEVGPLRVKVKGGQGSSSLSVVVDNHGNPLSTVELQQGESFIALKHGEDNTWTGPSKLSGTIALRISDVYAHQALVSGLALGQNDFQQSTQHLYGGPSPSPSTGPSTVESAAASASPSPERSVVPAGIGTTAPPVRC